MRSRFADAFNHDDDAAGYDDDVRREAHPIRAEYAATLARVAAGAAVAPDADVIDLGCGTGNLAALLPACASLTCVDVSREMLTRARGKLEARAGVHFVEGCLLACCAAAGSSSADAIVSTYAVHHLPRDEKQRLFEEVTRVLRPGGRAVFGDLMFSSVAARDELLARLTAEERRVVAQAAEEEFFWDVEESLADLADAGLPAEAERRSALSWIILARRARA